MTTLSTFELAYCACVMLLAYGLRGSTGFGGAVGMPLLALVVPLKLLVPVWTLLGFASSVAILGRDRRHVARRDFIAFLPWCLLGIGVGLYLFKLLDSRSLARGLGAVVLLYASYSLWAMLRPVAPNRYGPWLARAIGPAAGTLAGAVGALFGTMASVFFVMYLNSRQLAKAQFRATISAMLLTLSLIRGIGYYAVGEFTADVWIAFAVAFPMMLIGIYVGDRIQVNLREETFKKLVCGTLFLCGISLLLK